MLEQSSDALTSLRDVRWHEGRWNEGKMARRKVRHEGARA